MPVTLRRRELIAALGGGVVWLRAARTALAHHSEGSSALLNEMGEEHVDCHGP